MNILRIIRAKLVTKYTNSKEDWVIERRELCKKCPFMSKNNIQSNFKYKFWNFLNFKRPFCTICGCEIAAKTAEPLEECSLSELGKEPKWQSKF